jgi:hypothetical protein
VTKEEGWSGGPGVRLELSDRPQRDGSFDAPSFRSARVITLEGTAIAPDEVARERAKERLGAVLANGSRLTPLVVAERSVRRTAQVRLSSAIKIVDTTPVSFDWSMQVTAPDPLRYGDPHTLTCGLPRPGPGIDFPVLFPVRFGEPSDGRIVLTNQGTATAWPLWTITGPCVRPVIRNPVTGERLEFSLTLVEGDLLSVDTAARTVIYNQASRRAALVPGSRWFGVKPGATTVTFGAFDETASATLTASWHDAWI